MIYTIKHNEKKYQVDDEKMFFDQTKKFQKMWMQLDKTEGLGYDFANFDNCSVTVYDRGGIIITEKEVKDGE